MMCEMIADCCVIVIMCDIGIVDCGYVAALEVSQPISVMMGNDGDGVMCWLF